MPQRPFSCSRACGMCCMETTHSAHSLGACGGASATGSARVSSQRVPTMAPHHLPKLVQQKPQGSLPAICCYYHKVGTGPGTSQNRGTLPGPCSEQQGKMWSLSLTVKAEESHWAQWQHYRLLCTHAHPTIAPRFPPGRLLGQHADCS